ncbi:MAG: hypothetical protein AABZ36_08465 [Nitrospirota bacterium]
MSNTSLKTLNPIAGEKIQPFLDEILSKYKEEIHSIHITGSSITDDYNSKISDVNSIFVFKEMAMKFLEAVALLGKKYSRNRVAAPLFMTPEYIKNSVDVFPVEFLNYRLIHATVFGDDILQNIEINKMDLRRQCERELKVKLIWLRQGYISSLGNRKILSEGFVKSITEYIPLFRGIIVLLGKEPPIRQAEVITTLAEASGINTDVFTGVLREKHEKTKLSIEELNKIFEAYYTATEKLGKIVDAIKE